MRLFSEIRKYQHFRILLPTVKIFREILSHFFTASLSIDFRSTDCWIPHPTFPTARSSPAKARQKLTSAQIGGGFLFSP